MQYLRQAVETLIGTNDGTLPLSHYLKQYFKAHPKLGSRDRRAVSDAVYTYYRFARFVPAVQQDTWSIIQQGLKACGISNPFLEKLLSTMEIKPVDAELSAAFADTALTAGIEANAWKQSILQQPRLFLRIRQHKDRIISILDQQSISYSFPEDNILSLPNGTQIDKLLSPKDYVVQDYSSQHSLDLLYKHTKGKANLNVWDTCSGAGGKMLLLKDRYPEAMVISTDIRASILHNLKERATLYGHKLVQTKVVDSSDMKAIEKAFNGTFDWVISDVPCSGSGTWARTPEQFYFFRPEQLQQFSELQWSIARNTCRKVKPGGYFLYITCSVFSAENEEVVQRLLQSYPDMELVANQVLNGMEMQADCMYAALMKRKG